MTTRQGNCRIDYFMMLVSTVDDCPSACPPIRLSAYPPIHRHRLTSADCGRITFTVAVLSFDRATRPPMHCVCNTSKSSCGREVDLTSTTTHYITYLIAYIAPIYVLHIFYYMPNEQSEITSFA